VILARAGHAPPLRIVVEMAIAVLALVVTRPLLSTERARAEFAPVALRSWFLASAIGAMASGITFARAAQEFAHFSVLARDTFALAALALPLFIAGVGVLRMRTWGVVLGTLAALASFPIIVWMRGSLITVPILLASVPGALMSVLVVIARLRSEPAVRYRVATDVRVAEDEEEAMIEEWIPPASTSVPTSPMRSSIACTRR
jgi:hypothetical protein